MAVRGDIKMRVALNGLDNYIKILTKLEGNADKVLKKALYDGTQVMADELKQKISTLSAVPDVYNLKSYKLGEKYYLSYSQKKDLIDSLGIAKFRNEAGIITTHIGFDGYNSIKTKKYPNGQPNQLIARVVESGSSYMNKTPFIRPAVNSAKRKAEESMKKIIEEEINNMTKE